MVARLRVQYMKENSKYSSLRNGTIFLQKLFRGKVVLWKYQKYKKLEKEYKSRLMIQTQYRKYRACVRVRLIRYSLNKIYAATKINSIVRMYQAVQRVRSLVYNLLLKKCSIMIQSVARGFIGRRFVIKKILDLERFHAAKFIQKHIRGKIARLRLVGVRKAVNLYWNKQKISAITIQKLYRGFRGRIKTRSVVLEFKRKRKLLYDSATLIINMCRCFVAVSKSKRYVKER